MEFYRAFLAVAVGPAVLAELAEMQQHLQKRMPAYAVKWVPRDHMHITLKFFGDVPLDQIPRLAAAIQGAAAEHGSIRLQAQNLGCFPSLRSPRIIWVGLVGELDKFKGLQQAIERATKNWGDHQAERDFTPHLTLGRLGRLVKAEEAKKVGSILRDISLDSLGRWEVDKVELMRSQLSPQGPAYSVLSTLNLGR